MGKLGALTKEVVDVELEDREASAICGGAGEI